MPVMGNRFEGQGAHSAEHFGDTRDHWWNRDFLQLMAKRCCGARTGLDDSFGDGGMPPPLELSCPSGPDDPRLPRLELGVPISLDGTRFVSGDVRRWHWDLVREDCDAVVANPEFMLQGADASRLTFQALRPSPYHRSTWTRCRCSAAWSLLSPLPASTPCATRACSLPPPSGGPSSCPARPGRRDRPGSHQRAAAVRTAAGVRGRLSLSPLGGAAQAHLWHRCRNLSALWRTHAPVGRHHRPR